MLEVSESIVSFLKGELAFTEIMGQEVFPIMAPLDTPVPFTTYRINDKTPLSKDGAESSISLFFWFGPTEYKKMCIFTDIMEVIIKEKTNYEWVSTSSDFIEGNFSYVGIINLNTI